jgi:hypothetical protein
MYRSAGDASHHDSRPRSEVSSNPQRLAEASVFVPVANSPLYIHHLQEFCLPGVRKKHVEPTECFCSTNKARP